MQHLNEHGSVQIPYDGSRKKADLTLKTKRLCERNKKIYFVRRFSTILDRANLDGY